MTTYMDGRHDSLPIYLWGCGIELSIVSIDIVKSLDNKGQSEKGLLVRYM